MIIMKKKLVHVTVHIWIDQCLSVTLYFTAYSQWHHFECSKNCSLLCLYMCFVHACVLAKDDQHGCVCSLSVLV